MNRWHWAVLLALILYVVHFSLRSPFNNYQRPIIGDSMAYYSYLPAIFIYNSPEYSFLDEIEKKHYFDGAKKQFLVELQNGRFVNKTYPGAAILYLPFFLIAHILAMMFGDPDGFSIIYQLLFDFGHFFYVFLGIAFMLKILEMKKVSMVRSLLSVSILVLCSNYFYYIAFDQSLVHTHSMALINGALYFILKWEKYNYQKPKLLIISVVLLGLAVITRPTNLFAIVLILFFVEHRNRILPEILKVVVVPKVLIAILISVIPIVSIPVSLWYWQAGVLYAYSYGEEGFYFSNPELMNFLFSFNNGWFIYSPLLLIIIPLGIWKLFSKDIAGALLAVFFYGITIYVFSSWWCWYYGCSFGQRPMVDFYLLIAYLIALILEGIKSLFTKILVIAAVVFTGFLNIHQSYQNFNGYIECGMATSEMYWDNFLSFQRKARVYYNDNQIISSYSFDFESKNSNCSGEVEHSEARGGEYLIFVDSEHQFSGNIEILDTLFVSHPVVISAYVKAEGEINQTNLVVEHRGLSTTYRSFPLKAYVVKNEWIYMEFLYDNQYEISNDNLHVYFWNQNSSEKVYIDDLQIVILN